MKIALLSTNDQLGGAATVTYRLMEALRAIGEDARMLVAHRSEGAPQWVERVNPLLWQAAKAAERLQILANNGATMRNLWQVSTGRFSALPLTYRVVKEADVLVINWINQGLMSLSDIKALCRTGKPIVWIMHDLWCATGICHLPGGCNGFKAQCGNCPLLHQQASPTDLSHRVWLKKEALTKLDDIKFVAVSSWQRDICHEASLLADKEIAVIPHAFAIKPPVDYPHTLPPLLPTDKLIVMCAANLGDPVKDLPKAIESLNLLADKPSGQQAVALLVGRLDNADILQHLQLRHHHIPRLNEEELRGAYGRAHAVLSTSRYETMGATLMEGMAAGATPVTFGVGGQSDIVAHGINGYIADYGSAESVAHWLDKALTEPMPRAAQRRWVESRFGAEAVARRYVELFERLLRATETGQSQPRV